MRNHGPRAVLPYIYIYYLSLLCMRNPAASGWRIHEPRGFGWRIHCGVEVTELSTNKQHSLSHLRVLFVGRFLSILTPCPGLSHYHTSIGGHFWWLLQPAFPSFTDLFHYFFADLCRTLNLNLKQTYTLNPCFTDLFLQMFLPPISKLHFFV